MPEKEFVFIGIDLSDPFARHKRSATRAILRENLTCFFDEWDYQTTGSGILPVQAAKLNFILAIDGPQGLSCLPERTMRACDRRLRAAGKAGYELPLPGSKPYAGFIRGSVKLFYSLFKSGHFQIYGLHSIANKEANLIEVYPASAWQAIAGWSLPKKNLTEGRKLRFNLLLKKGLQFPEPYDSTILPNHDQLDAALAAYIAYLFKRSKKRDYGEPPFEDKKKGVLREGFIVQPC